MTSHNLHQVMSSFIQSTVGHRNICRVIDYEIQQKSSTDLKVENNIYVISESYNLCLFDLYCTSQAEKTELT